jgi:PKD repeat protein
VLWDFGDGATSSKETAEHKYREWNSAQKQRNYTVTLKATDGHNSVTVEKPITVKKIEDIRDGHFIGYPNSIVYHTLSGLEWQVGPDKDTTWDEAKRWVGNLSVAGKGWRMPTVDELKSLYRKDLGTRNMTPLLKTTGWWVWSGETKVASSVWLFGFSYGDRDWRNPSFSISRRGIAVRSRR